MKEHAPSGSAEVLRATMTYVEVVHDCVSHAQEQCDDIELICICLSNAVVRTV